MYLSCKCASEFAPEVDAPQEIGLRISVDHCLVGAITKILIEIRVLVKTHGDPVQLFNFCLFSMPADPTCDAPRKKETETKYTGEWLEKQRTKPICFVSRNQKRPGHHFYTCIVSWKRNTRKIRLCFLCLLFPTPLWPTPYRS